MENADREIVKQGKKFFSKMGLFFLIGTLVIFGAQTLIGFLIKESGYAYLLSNMNFAMIFSMIPMYLIGMPVLIALLKTLPAQKPEEHKMTFGSMVLAFMIGYAIMYVSNWIGTAITALIELVKGSPVVNQLETITTSLHPALSVLFMVICAPFIEEFVFRKILIDRAIRYGEGVAVLLSGLVFGLFHGNLSQFVYTFCLGAFLAFIYVRTGRLRYTIILHAVVNFMGGVIAPFVLEKVNDSALGVTSSHDKTEQVAAAFEMLAGFSVLIIYALLILGVSVAGIVLLIVFRKKFKLKPTGIKIPKGKGFSVVFLNLGMVALVLYYAAAIVLQLIS